MSRISKEAKVLIGLMIAAAAILIWVNYITQRQFGGSFLGSGGNSGAVVSQPATTDMPSIDTSSINTPSIDTPAADVVTDIAAVDTTTPDSVPEVAIAALPTVDGATGETVTEATSESATAIGVAPTTSAETVSSDPVATSSVEAAVVPVGEEGSPSVVATIPAATVPVVPAAMTTAARDVEIVALPFLLTTAPLLEGDEVLTDEAADALNRPGERRVSVNPFSPIVLQEVEVVAQPAPSPEPAIEQIVVVPEPPVITPPVEVLVQAEPAPVPAPSPTTAAPLRTFTPPSPLATNLPRPLPSGTLPVTPTILRVAQRDPGVSLVAEQPASEVVPLASANVRVPAAPSSTAPLAVGGAAIDTEEAVPQLLGVGAATEQARAASSCGPLAAGACSLSQYLRDTNVRFTGYVIGPVGVGVFRADGISTPVVLPIGQSLPDTDIVLTSLEGKQAEFSQGSDKQFLTLDFWR